MYVMCNLEKETTHDKIRLDLVVAPELHVHAYSLYII